MNGKAQAIDKISDFLKSDKRVLLVTGTHQYNKHKLVMALIDKYYSNANILFRINGMENLTDKDFLGFAGLRKKPMSGNKVKLGKNYYVFDSLNTQTWNRSGFNYDFSILYPLDSAMRGKTNNIIENLIGKTKGKVILISWTDTFYDSFNAIDKYVDKKVIYDVLEDDPEYHKRVINNE